MSQKNNRHCYGLGTRVEIFENFVCNKRNSEQLHTTVFALERAAEHEIAYHMLNRLWSPLSVITRYKNMKTYIKIL